MDGAKKGGGLLLLFVIAFVTLMDGIDGSIINVALPALAKAMNTDTGTIAWVTVSYFMMIAGLILVFGRIATDGAIRKVLVAGLMLFTVSSFVCGISDSLMMLIAARVFQGTGAAMMAAAVPIMCVKYLPANKLALGLGILTLGSSLGYSIGPALGGFIVDCLSWHWAFLINIPLGILVLPAIFKAVPKDTGRLGIPLDRVGSLTLFIAVISGIYLMERGGHPGNEISCLIAAIISLISLALFIFTERRVEHPLLNLRIFRNSRFVRVLSAVFLVNMSYMGILYLIPFHMHINLGMTSAVSGLYLLLPSVVTLIFVVPLSKWSDRTGRYWFSLFSCIIFTVAVAMWYIAAPGSIMFLIIAALILLGLSWALAGGAMSSRVVEEVSDESKEFGSSIMMEMIYLGCAVGTALYAMLFVFYTGTGSTSFQDLSPPLFLSGFMFALVVTIIIGVIGSALTASVSEKKAS